MEKRQKRGREERKDGSKYIIRSPYYEINNATDKVDGAISERSN